jgi:hypothetical protein
MRKIVYRAVYYECDYYEPELRECIFAESDTEETLLEEIDERISQYSDWGHKEFEIKKVYVKA